MLEKNGVDNDISKLEKLIKDLKEGEICPTCKRSLEEVDHSSEIKENEKLLKEKILVLDGAMGTMIIVQK